MTARSVLGGDWSVLAKAKVSINGTSNVYFDWGTPDNIYVPSLSGLRGTDRLVLILDGTTAGTTDTLTWVVEDAPDNAGSIGTTAAASVDTSLVGTTGDNAKVVGWRWLPERPWLKVGGKGSGATDTWVAQALLLKVPAAQ